MGEYFVESEYFSFSRSQEFSSVHSSIVVRTCRPMSLSIKVRLARKSSPVSNNVSLRSNFTVGFLRFSLSNRPKVCTTAKNGRPKEAENPTEMRNAAYTHYNNVNTRVCIRFLKAFLSGNCVLSGKVLSTRVLGRVHLRSWVILSQDYIQRGTFW